MVSDPSHGKSRFCILGAVVLDAATESMRCNGFEILLDWESMQGPRSARFVSRSRGAQSIESKLWDAPTCMQTQLRNPFRTLCRHSYATLSSLFFFVGVPGASEAVPGALMALTCRQPAT
eukprot:951091-Pelagomonas_calceolata.AAC.3